MCMLLALLSKPTAVVLPGLFVLQDWVRPEPLRELLKKHKLEVAADALRLPPWDADVSTLSGGERRRVALCRLLLSSPDMLLLDEPATNLDHRGRRALVGLLKRLDLTFVLATNINTSSDHGICSTL